MANYTKSHVVSVRLGSDVLDGVRERARAEGRSVSGELAFIVKEQVKLRYGARASRGKLTGWLEHLSGEGIDIPETLAEFKQARAELSARLLPKRGPNPKRRRRS
jgi:hypothetical protein